MVPMYKETVGFDTTLPCLEIPFDLKKYKWDVRDPDCMLIDSRLRLLSKMSDILKLGDKRVYYNYVREFTTVTNENPKCTPSQYSDCGFLPIGIEPEYKACEFNRTYIVPKLKELGLEFFLVIPTSPVTSSYRLVDKMAASHDIWVSKLEAAKVVKNKPVHNITTLDLLEVILPL